MGYFCVFLSKQNSFTSFFVNCLDECHTSKCRRQKHRTMLLELKIVKFRILCNCLMVNVLCFVIVPIVFMLCPIGSLWLCYS